MFQSLVPISNQRHRDLKLMPPDGYDYARRQTRVPVGTAEFVRAAAYYPIVFLDTPDRGPLPHALLGLAEGENLFVDSGGRWIMPHVPMAVARHPFVMAKSGDSSYTLSVDEKSTRLSTTSGTPLFDAQGQMSDLTRRIVDEQTKFTQHLNQAAALGAALAQHGLLQPVMMNLKGSQGQTISIAGTRVVDEKALHALGDDVALAWWKNGYLGFIHAHLVSIVRIQLMARRKFTSDRVAHISADRPALE